MQNAGRAEVNGYYAEHGLHDNLFTFRNIKAPHTILHRHHEDDTIWCLSNSLPNADYTIYYIAMVSELDYSPPTDGWSVAPGVSGCEPAPKLIVFCYIKEILFFILSPNEKKKNTPKRGPLFSQNPIFKNQKKIF